MRNYHNNNLYIIATEYNAFSTLIDINSLKLEVEWMWWVTSAPIGAWKCYLPPFKETVTYQPTNWPTDQPTNWAWNKTGILSSVSWPVCCYKSPFPPTSITQWLTDSHTHWLTHWLTYWLTDSLTHWLAHSLTDSLTPWLTHWLTYWLTDSLTDSLTHQRIDWPIDWLTDSLTHWLTH